MENRTLTDEQRKFLERMKDNWYFAHLQYTISLILDAGCYNTRQKKLLNRHIKNWKQYKSVG